jgi:hypothetical protein
MSGVTVATAATAIAAAAVVGGTVYSISEQKKATKKAEAANAAANANPVDTATAVTDTQAAQADIQKKRTNLFATDGGVSGQELNPNQVTKRQTLLGN